MKFFGLACDREAYLVPMGRLQSHTRVCWPVVPWGMRES